MHVLVTLKHGIGEYFWICRQVMLTQLQERICEWHITYLYGRFNNYPLPTSPLFHLTMTVAMMDMSASLYASRRCEDCVLLCPSLSEEVTLSMNEWVWLLWLVFFSMASSTWCSIISLSSFPPMTACYCLASTSVGDEGPVRVEGTDLFSNKWLSGEQPTGNVV